MADARVLSAILQLANSAGIVAFAGPQIAAITQYPRSTVDNIMRRLMLCGALMRVSFGCYRLLDMPSSQAVAVKDDSERTTVTHWKLDVTKRRLVPITLVRIPSLERPLP